jgi:hypothetical protein
MVSQLKKPKSRVRKQVARKAAKPRTALSIKLNKNDLSLLRKIGDIKVTTPQRGVHTKTLRVKDVVEQLAEEFHLTKYLKILKLDKVFNGNSSLTATIFALFSFLVTAIVTNPIVIDKVRSTILLNVVDPLQNTLSYYLQKLMGYLSFRPILAFIYKNFTITKILSFFGIVLTKGKSDLDSGVNLYPTRATRKEIDLKLTGHRLEEIDGSFAGPSEIRDRQQRETQMELTRITLNSLNNGQIPVYFQERPGTIHLNINALGMGTKDIEQGIPLAFYYDNSHKHFVYAYGIPIENNKFIEKYVNIPIESVGRRAEVKDYKAQLRSTLDALIEGYSSKIDRSRGILSPEVQVRNTRLNEIIHRLGSLKDKVSSISPANVNVAHTQFEDEIEESRREYAALVNLEAPRTRMMIEQQLVDDLKSLKALTESTESIYQAKIRALEAKLVKMETENEKARRIEGAATQKTDVKLNVAPSFVIQNIQAPAQQQSSALGSLMNYLLPSSSRSSDTESHSRLLGN